MVGALRGQDQAGRCSRAGDRPGNQDSESCSEPESEPESESETEYEYEYESEPTLFRVKVVRASIVLYFSVLAFLYHLVFSINMVNRMNNYRKES
jgi:hypothetical protein